LGSGSLRVYDFTAAAGRTSGSQNAGAFFALGGGVGNPQGIADPPAAMLLAPVAAPLAVTTSAALDTTVRFAVTATPPDSGVLPALIAQGLVEVGAPSRTDSAGQPEAVADTRRPLDSSALITWMSGNAGMALVITDLETPADADRGVSTALVADALAADMADDPISPA
jgi:hypothetical protein